MPRSVAKLPLSDDLQATTAMTEVTEAAMNHAAAQAAQQVDAVASGADVEPQANEIMTPVPDVGVTMMEETGTVLDVAIFHDEAAAHPMIDETETMMDAPEELTGHELVEATAELVETVETTVEAASDSVATGTSVQADALMHFRSKMSEVIQTNMDASMAFWTSLMRIKSPAEAIELNNRHVKERMETLLSQSRDLSDLAQKAVVQSMHSWTGSIGKLAA